MTDLFILNVIFGMEHQEEINRLSRSGFTFKEAKEIIETTDENKHASQLD